MLYTQILHNRTKHPTQRESEKNGTDAFFLTISNSQQSVRYTFTELMQLVDDLERYVLANNFAVPDSKHPRVVVTALSNNLDFVLILLLCAKLEWLVMPLSPEVSEENFCETLRSYRPDMVIYSNADARNKEITLQNLGYVRPKNEGFCNLISSILCKKEDKQPVFTAIDNIQALLDKSNHNSGPPYILTTTSGTTSAPKWMCLGQGTKLKRAESFFSTFELDANDRFIIATPLYHSLAQRILFTSLLYGEHCVLLERFSDYLFLQSALDYKVTVAVLVSTQIKNLLADSDERLFNLGALKKLISSSAKLDNDTRVNIVAKKNFEFYECYGASEVAVATSLKLNEHMLLDNSFNSVGKPISQVDIHILDDSGTTVDVNQVGEICIKSPLAFMGYIEFNNTDFISKSYVHTGDLGYCDENGYLYFVGRKKERINVGGTKVYPEFVENLAKEYLAANKDIGWNENYNLYAIPFPDDRLGEVVALVIEPPSLNVEVTVNFYDFCLFLLDKCENYQLPRHFFVLNEVPKTELGKIRRVKLAEYVTTYDRDYLEKIGRYFCFNY
ncbi:class I adenylate-forming enzyme family protein [Sessilibacter sp. MAH4]